MQTLKIIALSVAIAITSIVLPACSTPETTTTTTETTTVHPVTDTVTAVR